MRNFGLQPLKADSRDFQLGWIVRLPSLEELPKEYQAKTIKVKDQGNTDFCSAFATCYLSEAQEDIELEPAWSFAVSKEISGGVDEWGQDLRSAMKAHLSGALPKSRSPYDLKIQGGDYLRRIENWNPKLNEKARQFRKKSYFKVTGQYDPFDNIRASIWKFRKENRLACLGINWGYPLKNKILEEVKLNGYGHAVASVGWKTIKGKPYLTIVNSYGEDVGDKGYHYLSREVVNKWVDRYGAFMFVDIEPEEIKKKWSILAKIMNFIKKYVYNF